MSAHLEALARAFATPVTGPTYRPFTRVVAAALVGGLLVWGARAALASPTPFEWQQLAAGATIAVALLWPLPSLLFGRTVVDAEGIRQIGWMGREATWQQVQRVRFVRLALSPRLIVSVGLGRARVFYSGSRELDLAFEQAVALLTAPRPAEPPA